MKTFSRGFCDNLMIICRVKNKFRANTQKHIENLYTNHKNLCFKYAYNIAVQIQRTKNHDSIAKIAENKRILKRACICAGAVFAENICKNISFYRIGMERIDTDSAFKAIGDN